MNKSDRMNILENYVKIVQFMSKVSGDNTEISIIDYYGDHGIVYYVENGYLTNRKVNDKVSKLDIEKLIRNNYRVDDFSTNYISINEKNQKVFRQSTYYIKSEQGEIIGLICINKDLTKYLEFRKFYDKELLYGFDNPGETGRTGDLDLESVVEDMIKDAFIYWDRKKSINKVLVDGNPIKELYKKDVFKYKGSVNKVSEILDISPQTLYRYIKELEENI